MEISPFLFVRLILAALAFGGWLGVLHDLSRLVRIFLGASGQGKTFERLASIRLPIVGRSLGERKKGTPHRIALMILTFFQDVLWFLIAGVGTVILNYYYNDGKFRIYTVAALLIGFVVYYFTLGKLVMLFSEVIVFFVRSFCLIVFCLVCRPIAAFGRFFGKNAKKIGKKLAQSIAKKRKKVYNKRKSRLLLQKAECGFLLKDD